MGILFVHIMYIEHNLGKEYGRGKLRFAVNQGEVNQGKLLYIYSIYNDNSLKEQIEVIIIEKVDVSEVGTDIESIRKKLKERE